MHASMNKSAAIGFPLVISAMFSEYKPNKQNIDIPIFGPNWTYSTSLLSIPDLTKENLASYVRKIDPSLAGAIREDSVALEIKSNSIFIYSQKKNIQRNLKSGQVEDIKQILNNNQLPELRENFSYELMDNSNRQSIAKLLADSKNAFAEIQYTKNQIEYILNKTQTISISNGQITLSFSDTGCVLNAYPSTIKYLAQIVNNSP